jgi:LysM repeat protein
MNNQSPLVPQGSLLEQKNKGRTRVKVAVFFVLALHGIGLLALLMQGCNRNETAGGTPNTNSNSVAGAPQEPPAAAPSVPAAPTPPNTEPSNSTPPAAENTNLAAVPAAPPSNPAPALPDSALPANPAPAAGGTDHKVAKGETLAKIHKEAHVSLKALLEANPGVEPGKLKIGQVIHIPAPAPSAASTSTAAGGAASPSETAAGEQAYTVKSGDSLTAIAHQFGVKVKALRAANNMQTDKIKVGQKLKIPAKTGNSAASGGASSAAPSGK